MLSAVVISLLAAVASASPLSHVLREQISAIPRGFTAVAPASGSDTIDLKLGLVQGNPAGLEKELYAVSTPTSPRYGQHLTMKDSLAYLAPTAETSAAVASWLASVGVEATPYSAPGDWLSITLTVEKANELFNTEFTTYSHAATGKSSVRTLSYSIPASLQGHLDFVHPTVSFPVYNVRGKARFTPASAGAEVKSDSAPVSGAVPTSCNTVITPACLQAIYGIPTTAATQSTNHLMVTGYIDQYANQADLKKFLAAYRTDISSSTTFTLATLDGGTNPQTLDDAGIEADLDTQYTTGIATGVPITFLSVGDDSTDGASGFLDTLTYIAGLATPPTVVTTSYAYDEGDLSTTLQTNICNHYMTVGAAGTSILFSSGDNGVGGNDASCTTFVPTFPSVCPYVTSVGGTKGIVEVAASDTGNGYYSSGGFSADFPAPAYQSAVTAAYVASIGTTYAGKYTPTGRGFPDVSAQSVDFQIYYEGSLGGVDGTSASTPTFAAIIALLNDRLIAAGKSPLGFLNPWFYSNATTALHDVTSGTNVGCGTNGFSAKAGWDPVTGLGTPIWASLLTAAGL